MPPIGYGRFVGQRECDECGVNDEVFRFNAVLDNPQKLCADCFREAESSGVTGCNANDALVWGWRRCQDGLPDTW